MRVPFAVLALALAGCSGDVSTSNTPVRSRCEEAVARAVAPGTSDARLSALATLKYEIQDLKGFLLNNGYRGLRARSPKVVCGPYQLAPDSGLKACIASAQLCER